MKVQSIIPKFGENYDVGYIGFTYYASDAVSEGIAYFERWNRLSDIRVSHTFVVTGDSELVEAHIEHGVQRASLSKYFDDPKVQVFFRKATGWHPLLGKRIAEAAESKIGCPYGTGLILAEMAADTWIGHLVNKVCKEWPNRFVSWLLNRDTSFICSELVAYALSQQSEFRGRGILAKPLDTIDPQELFEDQVLFEDWVNASGHGPELHHL